MTSPNELANLLLSKINIYVTGACGPKRDGPLSCFQPVHQSYYRATPPTAMPVAQDLSRAFPGGSLRYLVPLPNIDNDTHVREHSALVYDRDIISTWRLPDTMTAYEIYF